MLFVLADLACTFVQYNRMVLDGDLTAIVLPAPHYAAVLHDPFGWAVLAKNEVYAAPNRFFAHATMAAYFRLVPGWLHAFLTPIASLYASAAIFSVLVQALLLYVLAVYATGTGQLSSWRLWLVMALLAPFFQAQGYAGEMAIIPQAISYTFFYPWPLLLLLVWLLPFYRLAQGQPWRLSAWGMVASLGLLLVLAFNGPIIPGVVAVLLLGIGVRRLSERASGPAPLVLHWQPALLLVLLGLLCAYSLYIGRNNAENLEHTRTLWERYQLLPMGVFKQLTGKLGMPLLLVVCMGNAYLLRRWAAPTPENRRIRLVLRWVGWFALAYVLLLPLGGYRTYRPYLLRFDSISPITLGLIFFYALSAGYLLQNLVGRARIAYVVGVAAVFFIYANADRKLQVADGNDCERAALTQLAWAPANQPVVHLDQNCTVLSWNLITDPATSATNAAMLEQWGITQGTKQYYH
ncbi:hypothetical protein [Hymenobacter sp. BRD67]|uniref:hypothetical protein n=1 Tax=Hymenobacter sp. BRD67 TaxID=2675877 RepID=UPI001566965E|nr:hypothetical protein [Hymenobacter sp. BRD67]QKG53395.1 hypothetical protein GKZ67_13330 [Hymenobacter sp. BRD67]